jgi:hypothetical protein
MSVANQTCTLDARLQFYCSSVVYGVQPMQVDTHILLQPQNGSILGLLYNTRIRIQYKFQIPSKPLTHSPTLSLLAQTNSK